MDTSAQSTVTDRIEQRPYAAAKKDKPGAPQILINLSERTSSL